MSKHNYDIFISYRRKYSGDKPEMLQLMLEESGFRKRVSFDKDNLSGRFDVELIRRIDECKNFIMFMVPDTFTAIRPLNEEAVKALLERMVFFGLQRGFKNAGVQTILMTLSAVDAQASMLFMTQFYKNIIWELFERKALIKAQQYLRENGYADSKFWVPFILLDANR